jgi:hypothetical protein
MSANTANLYALEADIQAFGKKLDLAPQLIVRRIVADLHNRVAKRTPVDTGRARASWDVKEGSPSDYVPPITVGKTGSAEAKNIAANLESITGEAPVFITSALDYMKYLEDGSSQQAPAGMVRISLAEIEIEIEDIIGEDSL